MEAVMENTDMLSEQRIGEIALMYIKMKVRNDMVPMSPERLRKEIGNAAKEMGIEYQEAVQVANIILRDAFSNVLAGISKEKRGPGF